MLEPIKIDFHVTPYIDHPLKSNQVFILNAMRVNPLAIHYADRSLRSNQVFILEAIKIEPRVILWADSSLKSSPAFMLKAINIHYRSIAYADSSLKNNLAFMLDAMRINPHTIFHASRSLKSNLAFMLEAIKIHYRTIAHADRSLKSNLAFMLEVIKIDYRTMAHADRSLKSNLAFMLEAIKIDYRTIDYADRSLKSNLAFMLEAIKIDYRTVDYADRSLKSNQAFMLEAIKIDYRTMVHGDSYLKTNQVFMLEAIKTAYQAMAYTNLKNNPAFILEAIKINYQTIAYVDKYLLKNDHDFMLKCIKIDYRIIKYIPKILKLNDHFMNLVVLEKPQAVTFSGDIAINSIMNLEKLHLAPPSMKRASLTLENLGKYDIMNLSEEFDKLTESEILKYELLSKSPHQNERESANKALKDLQEEGEKLAHLCSTVKKEPSKNVSEAKKIFYEHLSFLLKSIISQWQSSKGLKCKDENLRALAYAATKCEPTWLEEATRIHFALEGSGTPETKLLTLVQKYKEATILQYVQEDNQWHALNRIRRDYGKNLGLNTDLAKHDMYINTGEENSTPTIWTIKALWDAPSLLESVHTALSNQEYDRSLYDFLLEMTKKKNIENPIDYVADNFYEEDCTSLKLHGIHAMLIHIEVLETVPTKRPAI